MPQIVTASRLADGVVVFLDEAGGWSDRLDRAALLGDKRESAIALEIGKAAEAASLVIDVYAVDVSTAGGSVVPVKLREAIRARGPTVLPEFTKPGSTPARAEEDDHVSV